jgi:endonuclease I
MSLSMPRFTPTNNQPESLSRVMSIFFRMFVLVLGFGILQFVSMPALGQNFDPPFNYYDSATGTGSTLQSQLHNIIDNHTMRSYGDARSLLQITDADPDRPGHMILAYSNVSLNVAAINPNGSIPGWDSAATWNREHTWPRSRGIGSSGPDDSDLHQLRPTFTNVNSDRASLNFGGAFGSNGGNFGTLNDGSGTVWYPGNVDAGRIARQQFYLDVRYDGSDSATIDLELANNNPGGDRLGDLGRMIEWHFAAPVDEFERRRNDIIFDNYQGNRNPFIDRPEFVWSVFVDQSNDSRIEFAGGTTDSNGVSTLEINERAIFGNPAPITTQVTLNKTGQDGTYFWVETSGDITSSLTSPLNAFRSSQTDSMTFTIEIPSPGFGVGTRSGTVTVDNLDITNQGGTGRGDNDGDDVLIASFTALAHSAPSFSAISNVSTLTVDLGDFFIGSQFTPSAEVDVFNRASFVGPDLTANLDLDAIVESDSLDKFAITGGLFSNLAPNDSQTFSFTGASDELGTFTAQYEFQVSDEDIEGEDSSTMNLTLTFDVVGVRGDFNTSGNVDDADINFYTQQLGQAIDAESALRELDLNDDGMITIEDHGLHVTTLAQTSTGVQGTILGDVNLDGTVNVLGDAFILISNLGANAVVGFGDGDLNADGVVDVLGDAFVLISNLGQSVNN